MFRRLGNLVTRHWLLVLAGWAVLVAGPKLAHRAGIAPTWNEVTYDGDLEHLPAEMTSARGEALIRRAFPKDRAKSQIVLVLARQDARLTPADLKVAESLARTFRDLRTSLPILDVWTHRTPVVGRKLRSRDRQSVLVVLQLAQEFMATENIGLLQTVREKLDAARAEAPAGLELGITGSAAIGGDMLTSAAESIRSTETFAVLLVIVILLVVYRAPLLVVVPLLSIVASISVATDLVAFVADLARQSTMEAWQFKIFKTTKIFVVVILYGAGTDYCLFLIARYKEELGRGLSPPDAVARALSQVGDALFASALTTVVGLGTMAFADFGKFSSSGPAIAVCLLVALLACVTLAPALLMALGRIVFWPFGAPAAQGPASGTPRRGSWRGKLWPTAADHILTRPGLILTASLLLMLPFAWKGQSVRITYDLLGELQRGRPSVAGTALLRRHFPAGETGPLTVLALKSSGGFDSTEGERNIALLTKTLYDIPGVTAVRSLAEPLGDKPGYLQPFSKAGLMKLAAKRHAITKARFVAQVPRWKGHVARFDVVLAHDPFSPNARAVLDRIDARLSALASTVDSAWHDVQFEFVGTTAAIRDLKNVTESDRRLIQKLAVIAVLGVLILILRRPLICLYLIFSVLLSYFVTIGATQLFFEWLFADTFAGLDWKVPIFLFVILIAVGEDYNIYLTTRVFEEQRRRGPADGLREAIVQTGGIITSCGVIMAGTFVSMMSGSLRGMLELGFALSLGVLLDTFLVRTFLVPSFLAILARRSATHQRTAAGPTPHGVEPRTKTATPARPTS